MQSPWRVVDVSFWSDVNGVLSNLTLVLTDTLRRHRGDPVCRFFLIFPSCTCNKFSPPLSSPAKACSVFSPQAVAGLYGSGNHLATRNRQTVALLAFGLLLARHLEPVNGSQKRRTPSQLGRPCQRINLRCASEARHPLSPPRHVEAVDHCGGAPSVYFTICLVLYYSEGESGVASKAL